MDQHILWGQALRSPLSLSLALSTSLQIKSWCLAAAIVALKVSLRIVGDLHNGIMEGLGVRQRTDTVRTELNSRLPFIQTRPLNTPCTCRAAFQIGQKLQQPTKPACNQTLKLCTYLSSGFSWHIAIVSPAMQLNECFCCTDVSPAKTRQ